MFLRTTKVKRSDGTVDEYIRLVESDWNAGRPRHRVICNLGRVVGPARRGFVASAARKNQAPSGEARGLGGGSLGLGSDAGGATLLAAAGSRGDPRLVGEATWPEARTGGPCSRLGEQSLM